MQRGGCHLTRLTSHFGASASPYRTTVQARHNQRNGIRPERLDDTLQVEVRGIEPLSASVRHAAFTCVETIATPVAPVAGDVTLPLLGDRQLPSMHVGLARSHRLTPFLSTAPVAGDKPYRFLDRQRYAQGQATPTHTTYTTSFQGLTRA